MAPHNTQIVGQSLTLECSVTTVRGITSRVDIVWRRGGVGIERVTRVNVSLFMESTEVYSASYTIPLLSTIDDGKVYQCEVVISTSPLVMATDNFTLDVIGLTIDIVIILKLILYFSSHSSCINGAIWVSRGSYSR